MRIALLCEEHTFVAPALEAKDDIEGSVKVDTNEGTTRDWLGLPYTALTPSPVPAAKKLAAELANEEDSGRPPEQCGVAEL